LSWVSARLSNIDLQLEHVAANDLRLIRIPARAPEWYKCIETHLHAQLGPVGSHLGDLKQRWTTRLLVHYFMDLNMHRQLEPELLSFLAAPIREDIHVPAAIEFIKQNGDALLNAEERCNRRLLSRDCRQTL
jgi:hypothetical protein